METERVDDSIQQHQHQMQPKSEDGYLGNLSYRSGPNDHESAKAPNQVSSRRPLIAIIYDQAESLISSDLDENDKKVLTDNLEHLKQLEHLDQQLLDSSNLGKLQFLKINNDITTGLANFEFEHGLENEDLEYYFVRLRTHCFYTTACAHAAYFVGVANSIRRNLDEIKRSNNELVVAKRTKLIIDNGKKRVGLRIGIIGCGSLGRQLAQALLNYGDVMPNELQISTRQPEKIDFLKARGVKCYYDNAKLASTSNVVFLCVLPHQLDMVINDIKPALPDKCFIYSFVRAVSAVNLKGLFKDLFCSEFVIKPQYSINKNFNAQLFKKWNYNGDIIESLDSSEIVNLTNPFGEQGQMIIQSSDFFTTTLIYAIMNICAFLTLNRKETMNSLKSFLFDTTSKSVKLEENYFSESNSASLFFPIVNLVDASIKPTSLLNRIQKSKSFKAALFRNYNLYFLDTFSWKNSSTP